LPDLIRNLFHGRSSLPRQRKRLNVLLRYCVPPRLLRRGPLRLCRTALVVSADALPPAEMPNRAVVVASLCMLATSLRSAQSRMDHSTAPSGYQPADRRLWVRVDPEELGRVPDEPGLCLGFPPLAGH